MKRLVQWSFEHGELAEALGRLGGEGTRLDAGTPPSISEGERALSSFMNSVLAPAHLEAAAIAVPYAELGAYLASCAPALLRLPGDDARYLVVRRVLGRQLLVATPTRGDVRVACSDVAAVMREAVPKPACEALFERAGLRGDHGERARAVLADEWLRATPVQVGWALQLAPGASFAQRARSFGLLRQALQLLGASAALYILWIGAWWLLGRGALQGRLDRGWLTAWGLMLMSLIPLRALRLAAAGELAVRVGSLLRGWLLAGSLQLDSEEIRTQGPGQLLGVVLESEILEKAMTTGVIGLVALLEVALGAGILTLGAGGPLQVVLLLFWLLLGVWLTRRLVRKLSTWTNARLPLTCELVEEMIGQRTRVAQLGTERVEARTDLALGEYHDRSVELDREALALMVGMPRGWLLLGMGGLLPSFIYGSPSPAGLAIGLGGVLLIYQAMRSVGGGLVQFALARVTWDRLRPLFEAAQRPQDWGVPSFAATAARERAASGKENSATILEAHGLGYRYDGRSRSVFESLDLKISEGERILIQGPSGSGKSTLASLLSGSRKTREGVLLFEGLDRATMGAHGWRKQVVLAPQFHENHVLSDTFAFNLLMGNQWPPTEEALKHAYEVCQDLGLDSLLERMPNGMHQMVGETGWQLSHGERSRLFIARALLQDASLIILDESLSTLDPLTLERTLACVEERSGTVVLIEHG